MDFWETALAVVVGMSVWKIMSGFTTKGDREELRLEREREQAEATFDAYSPEKTEKLLKDAHEMVRRLEKGD